MCLAIPAKIIALEADDRAMVSVGGAIKEISTAFLQNVVVGDYVIVHVGYALTKLNEDEALKTIAIFEKMMGQP